MKRSEALLMAVVLATLALVVAVACGSGTEGPAPAAETSPSLAPLAQAQEAPTATPSPPPPSPTSVPPTATPETVAASSTQEADDLRLPAPELAGITSWINSDPFTLESQRGNVVLIDFWTYTCINCIRTLPFLKEWHQKYEDRGLVVIGVHAPEFEFEKDRDNMVEAMEKYGLEYAVAQDNDFGTWRAYENNFWPAKYLIDKDGFIRYRHFGEGAYAETERWIRMLLEEAEAAVADVPMGEDEVREYDLEADTDDPAESFTRELYAGFERNASALNSGRTPPYVGQTGYYVQPDEEVFLIDEGEHFNHFLYAQGWWRTGLESLVHARETEDYEDWIALKFFATTVNVVMSASDEAEPYAVRVTLDGAPLTGDSAGSDIMFDDEGNSYVKVIGDDMYRLVSTPSFEGHELKLSSNSSDFAVFAFTFGAFRPQDS